MDEEEANICVEYFKKYDRVKISVLFDAASVYLPEYKTSDIKVRKYFDDFNEEWRVDIDADGNHFTRTEDMIFIELSESCFTIRYNWHNTIEFKFYNAEQ